MHLNVNNALEMEISDSVFNARLNESLIHQVVVAYMAGSRQGSKKQKTRSEVSGGGKRPWRQKGTGRARAGTIRSPIWRGGGVTFAAVPRDYSKKINKKMYRAAMRSILSDLLRSGHLLVVDEFSLDYPKTKDLLKKLVDLGLKSHTLIISDNPDQNLYLSARNIPNIEVNSVVGSNPVSLLSYDNILMTLSAVKKFEEILG